MDKVVTISTKEGVGQFFNDYNYIANERIRCLIAFASVMKKKSKIIKRERI